MKFTLRFSPKSVSTFVGYQTIEIPAGYSLYTVTFKDVSGGDYALQDMRVLSADGTTEENSDSLVTIQGMTTGGAYDSTQSYSWRNYKSDNGWYVGRNKQIVSIKSASAFCINNTTEGKVYFRVAGGVELSPVTEEIPVGYGLFGNMTPCTIKPQDIQVFSGDQLNADDSLVTIQGMTTAGAYDSTQSYSWRCYKNVYGWYVGRNMPDVDILPGQTYCLNNTTLGTITLKFKSPITPATTE